jgi:calcineurin-like phosphoesterase family protein
MAGIFFTADTHFGSKRTLEFSRRPYRDIKEMDRAMVANWNSTVGEEDTIYHLGDFGVTDNIRELRGHIIFLPGNYDNEETIAALRERCEIIEPNTLIHRGNDTFQLVHEPDEAEASDQFFLYGHIHKLQMVKRNALNVGVDCHHFTPLSLEDVLFYRNAILKAYDENVFLQVLGERGNVMRNA